MERTIVGTAGKSNVEKDMFSASHGESIDLSFSAIASCLFVTVASCFTAYLSLVLAVHGPSITGSSLFWVYSARVHGFCATCTCFSFEVWLHHSTNICISVYTNT